MTVGKEWVISFAAAIFLHLFLFFGSGFALVQAPQFGIEASTGGIEVSLIAALPATAEKEEIKEKAGEKKKPDEENEFLEEKKPEAEKEEAKAGVDKDAPKKNYSFVNNTPYSGDGTSSMPGQSPTTFYSPGGGLVSGKAGFLKNTPPSYPSEAVNKGQEGLVLLTARVDASGSPEKVEIKKTSGHRRLDEAALKAVRRWKFDPAHMGMLRVEAAVDIPIRFVLEDELKRRGKR